MRKYKKAKAEGNTEKIKQILGEIYEYNKALLRSRVNYTVKRYENYNLDPDDLMNEAFIALVEALNDYTLPEDQEFKFTAGFITYATHKIRGRLTKYAYKISLDSKQFKGLKKAHLELLTTEDNNAMDDLLFAVGDMRDLIKFLRKYYTQREVILIFLYHNLLGPYKIENPITKRDLCALYFVNSKVLSKLLTEARELLLDYVESNLIANNDWF